MSARRDLAYLCTQQNAYYRRVHEWRRDPDRANKPFPVKPPVVHPRVVRPRVVHSGKAKK